MSRPWRPDSFWMSWASPPTARAGRPCMRWSITTCCTRARCRRRSAWEAIRPPMRRPWSEPGSTESLLLRRLGRLGRLADRLDVEDDLDVVTEDRPTALDDLVPRDAEVLAVDLGARLEAAAVAAPAVRAAAEQIDVERHRLADSLDGEGSLHLRLAGAGRRHLGRHEGDLR